MTIKDNRKCVLFKDIEIGDTFTFTVYHNGYGEDVEYLCLKVDNKTAFNFQTNELSSVGLCLKCNPINSYICIE